MKASNFIRREANGIPFYSCLPLEELPHVRHGFSTRIGDAGARGEAPLNLGYLASEVPGRVSENRRRFLAALHLENAPLATLRQVHSDRLHIIEDIAGQWNRRPDGDALATVQDRIALGILVADCFPILIADPDTEAVAAIHAGWRGSLRRILSATVAGMRSVFGCDPARLLAAIGPGIRSCCFEVGPEVAARFEAAFPDWRIVRRNTARRDRFLLDLPGALIQQGELGGLRPERIHDLGACTRCRPDEFFSYRAEGERSGRMMAVIARVRRSPEGKA